MPVTCVDVPDLGVTTLGIPGWTIPRRGAACLADCCLIIPTYKRPREATALLKMLADRADAPGEIIIADGYPRSGLDGQLRDWAAARTLPFDLIYVRCPAGLTRQRNIGIDISSRPYVFFLDDDSVPLEDYFRQMREVFVNDVARRIGAVGGCVVDGMDRPLSRKWRLRLGLRLIPRVEPGIYASCGTSTPRALAKRFRGLRRVDVLPGCAFAFRREVLERHRFSSFFAGYSQGEDLEMSLRVGCEWEIVCCGDAEMLHEVAPGGRPPSFTKGRMEVRNRFFIWKRHRPRTLVIDRFRFWSDIALLVAFDACHFLLRPWRPASLAHAAGILYGVLGCVFAPPRHTEPRARREYHLDLEAAAAR
ncbi:MAG: glycosyltransferase family 2 protein [Acidobacteriaceae bacterium]|nr:glycosyltransferase family 2 protein [Acidobacteriaceae bacterium]